MTLHQLKIFQSVGTLLNITKASEILHISQPSVSQQLKLLEEEFGTKFFARLSQGVELTYEGKQFLDAVSPILAQAELVERTFKRNPKQAMLLKIGGSHNVSFDVLPELLDHVFENKRASCLMNPRACHETELVDAPVVQKKRFAVVGAGLYHCPSIREAEAAKVLENTQRDINIALMNEMAIICEKLGIRTREVLRAAGTKWNFLNFEPGLVGGHCVAVDP